MSDQIGIFVGIPNEGLIRVEVVRWLQYMGIKAMMPSVKPLDHSRNLITKSFLDSEMDWLLMFNSRVLPPENIMSMVTNDVPICSAGVRANKFGELIPLGMMKTDDGYVHDYKYSRCDDAPHKVDVVGTGCILIRRDVFSRMEEPYWRFGYDAHGILTDGEDFEFCERSTDDVYYDPRYPCKHFTTVAI